MYWLRARVGSTGSVIAFEPQPALASALAKLVEHRCWSNVHVHQLAVSDAPGILQLGVPGNGGPSPGARLLQQGDASDWGAVHEVQVLTLDAFLADAGDSRRPIRFIKCDVEGAELSVFKGGEAMLRADRPDLLFECEQRHLRGSSVHDVFAFLQDLGYEGRFFHRGRLRPLHEFSLEQHQALEGERGFDHRDYCNNFAFTATH